MHMPRPVRRLSNMEIDEISLVDKGANQHAMITIAKRAPEEETMPELYNEDGELLDENALEDGDVVYDDAGNAYEFTLDDEAEDEVEDDPELAEVGKAFGTVGERAGAFRNAFTGARSARKAGKTYNVGRKYGKQNPNRKAADVGAHLGYNTSAYGARAGVGAAAAGGVGYGVHRRNEKLHKSFSESVMEELSKAYSDEDRDQVISKALGRVEELENRYAEAEEIAKSERDLRLTREYISKAAEYNLPVDPAELGPVLYRMTEAMDYDDCAVIAKCLEGAGAMIFEEQGYIGGGDNADIMSQVEAQAVEIGKSASAENVVTVFDQSPDAYDEYLAQRGRY